MSCARAIGAIALLLAAEGCSIHPLPDDVTGVSTYHIVRRIRCEARKAIFDSAIGWLTDERNLAEGKVDPESRQIGLEFAEHARPIQSLNPKLFKGRVHQIIAFFYETGIAYNFNLAMTEKNNFDPTIDLLKPMKAGGKATLGVSANADRLRQTTRVFTVTDTFSGLIQKIPDDYCTDYIVQENHVYPITGKIGMEKFIQDFIQMALFANLAGPVGKESGPPTMVDTLEFTTTFSVSATPKVVFAQIGNPIQVADISLNVTASRTDDHKVTVGLAIGGPALKQVAPLRNTLFTPLLTATGGPTEQAAAAAVNQALTLKVFQPTIVISPTTSP